MAHPPPLAVNRYREARGGSLRLEDAGRTVRLAGWVAAKRDHGGLLFVDLRDAGGVAPGGLVQLVAHPDQPAFEVLTHLRVESVISVTGEVVGPPARDGQPQAGDRRPSKWSSTTPRCCRAPRSCRSRREGHRSRRGDPPALPLPRPAPRPAAGAIGRPGPAGPAGPEPPGRARLPRGADPGAHRLVAGGRPGLPGAQPPVPGRVLRPAPGARSSSSSC